MEEYTLLTKSSSTLKNLAVEPVNGTRSGLGSAGRGAWIDTETKIVP